MKTKKSKPQKAKSQGNIYDTFVKRMFGRILVIMDFLLYYADPRFVAAIDLKKIKPAPTHYIGKAGDERIIDLVFLCPLKNGGGTLMAVIIFEHQSGSLKKIPRKLHKYISAIWDAEEKEGKPLSAPYFIVLRVGKKPHRGAYPKMADSLPKDKDGRPVGKVVEVEYDVVDLPAWDFKKLVGGPVLRLALGVLKKMTEDAGLEFSEALLPLLEIDDEEQKVDLTKDVFPFIAKVFVAHGKWLDEPTVCQALKPIFKEKTMIRTIFEEKYDIGYSEGKADGYSNGKAEGYSNGKIEGKAEQGRNTLLKILRARFRKVPRDVESVIRSMVDPVALDSWAVHAATCQSMDEFAQSIR